MPRVVTERDELKAVLDENGPDEPANAAFLSNLSGWPAREVMAANIFWETGDVAEPSSLPSAVTVYVNDDGEPPGVVVLEDLPPGHWTRDRKFLVLRCRHSNALEWVVSLLPAGGVSEVEIEQQDLVPEIEKRAMVKECYDRLYFTVTRNSFKPVASREVVWLGEGNRDEAKEFSRAEAADGGLADFYLALQLAGLPFSSAAMVRSGRISSFCCIGKKTEHVWSVRWICTRAERRRRGEGKRVLSAATAKMLEMGGKPLYAARDSNVASRRLCESLGYKLVSVRTHLAIVPKATRRSGR